MAPVTIGAIFFWMRESRSQILANDAKSAEFGVDGGAVESGADGDEAARLHSGAIGGNRKIAKIKTFESHATPTITAAIQTAHQITSTQSQA